MIKALFAFPVEKEGGVPSREDSLSFLVCGGGPEPNPSRLAHLLPPSSDGIIAADGGWRLACALNLKPQLIIGDLDTLTPDEVTLAQNEGIPIERHCVNKNESDLELAIFAAHRQGATRLTLIGVLGGQWDHCLLNLLAPLSLCHQLGIWARLVATNAEIYLLTPGSYQIQVPLQSRISLAALSPRVEGLTSKGLFYRLKDDTLSRHQTRGLANITIDPLPRLQLNRGELLLVLERSSF